MVVIHHQIGEADLKGKGKVAFDQEKKSIQNSEEQEKRRSYLGYVDQGVDEGQMMDAVTAGLQASKKSKPLIQDSRETLATSSAVQSSGNEAGVHGEETSPLGLEHEDGSDEKLVSSEGPAWLEVLSGDLVVYADGLVDGVDGFGTVAVPQAMVSTGGLGDKDVCRWYYEVELVTGGLFQVCLDNC